MDERERLLRIIAETSKNENQANLAMDELRKINQTYHWCPDWDYMVICDKDKEYEYTCISE